MKILITSFNTYIYEIYIFINLKSLKVSFSKILRISIHLLHLDSSYSFYHTAKLY